MTDKSIKLAPDWMVQIGSEFDQPYMQSLRAFLQQEKSEGKVIYPKGADIFNSMNTTPFNAVEVVILGQDPYHGEGQAHGLSFSVPSGIRIPPSLINIYKEIEAEYGVKMRRSGDLSNWARQGVLLLNATLTVQQGLAGSHQKRGWENFTDAIIRAIDAQRDHVVFMLWGSYAQKKGAFINRTKHLVLESVHPSPLSAHRGFLGNGHFRAANDWLEHHGKNPIRWEEV